jgi:hypothetical protein
LELKVDLDEGQNEAFTAAAAERITAALAARGIELAEGATRTLVVDVHWAPGTQTDYVVFFNERGETESLTRLTGFDCNHCTPSQFWDRLEQALADRVVPALLARLDATEPAAESDAETSDAEPPPQSAAPPPSPAERDDAAMFYTGIGLLTLGGGFVLGSSAVLVVDEIGGLPKRPVEWTLLGVGAGAMAIGGTLVGLARSRSKKNRRVSLAPGLLPSGVALTGRF